MKKYIKSALLGAASLLTVASCTSDFEEINTDPKKPVEVDPSYIVSTVQMKLVDVEQNSSVNWSNVRLFAQYWMQVTYVNESQYVLNDRDVPGTIWDFYYILLNDLQEAKSIVESQKEALGEDYDKQMAVLTILDAYAWMQLSDFFSNIPYTEALGAEAQLYPKYDDAQTVYLSLLSNLEEVLNKDLSGTVFAATDVVYNGDVEQWNKFGASLMMRMAMRMADTDPQNSVKYFDMAVESGYINSIEDEMSFPYRGSAPNANPVFEYYSPTGSNRPKEFNMASTLVDAMNDLDDPRREFYMDDNPTVVFDNTGNIMKDHTGNADSLIAGVYLGIPYGGPATTYTRYSHISPGLLENPTLPGKLFSLQESNFLMAEAAARGGYNVSGSAAQYYTNAVRASLEEWGVAESDILAYISRADVDYSQLISSGKTYKEIIGLQKWIANYNVPVNGWREAVRLGGAPLVAPASGPNTDIIIQRYTYPASEQQLNGDNRAQASSEIGGDRMDTKMWWMN